MILLGFQAEVSGADGEAQQSILPDLEFLEFLGQFETDSGEWMSPADLVQPDFDQLLQAIDATDEHDSTEGEDADNASLAPDEADDA